MQVFPKIKQPLEETIRSIRKILFDFLIKHREFEDILACLSSKNIFFWLEFISGIPWLGFSEELQCNTFELKDFITTRTRKKLINKLVNHIESGVPLLVQKTTGLGATTCIISVALWYLTFRPATRIVIVCPSLSGSRFSSTAKKLFEYIKLFVVINNNAHWHMQLHNDLFRFYTIENISSGTSIILLPSNKPLDLAQLFPDDDNCQNSVVIFEEMAFQKEADTLWHSLDGTGVNRIAVSSANGRSNLFYELLNRGNIPVHTMHWIHEPDCNKKWYQKMCAEKDPAWVEQYINIDYNYRYRKSKSKNSAAKAQEEKIQTITTGELPEKKAVRSTVRRKKDPNKPARKQHRNPCTLKKPCDYNTALIKYVKTASRKQKPVSKKTALAIMKHKDKLSAKEPRLVESMYIAQELVETVLQRSESDHETDDLYRELASEIKVLFGWHIGLLIPEPVRNLIKGIKKRLTA